MPASPTTMTTDPRPEKASARRSLSCSISLSRPTKVPQATRPMEGAAGGGSAGGPPSPPPAPPPGGVRRRPHSAPLDLLAEGLQRCQHLVGRGGPVLGVLGQELEDEVVEGWRKRWVVEGGCHRRRVQGLGDDGHRVMAGE